MDFIELYNLKEDEKHIQEIQHATLYKKDYGFKMENGLLFGSIDWFNAIDAGKIQTTTIRGTITDIYMTGDHNESREFELSGDLTGEKSTWEVIGKWKYYQIGKKAEITYVLQKLKKKNEIVGSFLKCILLLKVEK